MIYKKMLKEKEKIEQEIQVLKKQLSQFPEGKIFCCRSGKYVKWFHSDGKKQVYIPKKKRKFAEQLALKKYHILRLKNLEQEKIAIDFYLRHHIEDAESKVHSIVTSPEYQELLSPYFKPISQELSEWMNSPYQKNKRNPEHLTNKTLSGGSVRSKSEAMIDMVLFKSKIPYRYECCLQLDNIEIYPDFTIRHPETGEIYYWEHFGLMDDVNYKKKAFSKLQHYVQNGIIPGIQLITTYETKDYPLSLELIEKIVEYYFM